MAIDVIDAYPWFLNKDLPVVVDNVEVNTRIHAGEWGEYWRPLLSKINELHLQKPRRIMIAIAGSPGCGKSVLAEQFSWMIGKGFLHNCNGVSLPMDGFHYDMDYLRTHFRKHATGIDIPLANVKGAPDTYDGISLKQNLERLKACGEEVAWPGYSRTAHEVIPAHFHVFPSTSVIIVEGNYLLLNRGPFAGIPDLFDFKIYIDVPAVAVLNNLLQRHIAGGRAPAIAREWVKRIDVPNAKIVESTKHHADVVVQRSGENEITGLHWKGQAEEDIMM